MGGTQQLARLAGGVAGLGLAFAAAAPFSGVPPQGGSGAPTPAQVEVRSVASGELAVDPVGVVLKATSFPEPGASGGPSLRLTLRNATAVPLRISLRLAGLSPSLDDAVDVRASAAGAVLVEGPLRGLTEWTTPAGVLSSGQQTTLRMRLKLRPGLEPDAYRGRFDLRQLEVRGMPITPTAGTTPAAGTAPGAGVTATTPGAAGTAAAPATSGNASIDIRPATTPGTTP